MVDIRHQESPQQVLRDSNRNAISKEELKQRRPKEKKKEHDPDPRQVSGITSVVRI